MLSLAPDHFALDAQMPALVPCDADQHGCLHLTLERDILTFLEIIFMAMTAYHNSKVIFVISFFSLYPYLTLHETKEHLSVKIVCKHRERWA